MLEWYIGAEHDFEVSAGKMGKYFKKYLPEDLYQRFRATYTDAEPENIWNAAFSMLYLFGDAARAVAANLGFSYDVQEEKGIEQYMTQVKEGLLQYE